MMFGRPLTRLQAIREFKRQHSTKKLAVRIDWVATSETPIHIE